MNRIFSNGRPVHYGYAHFEAGAEPDPVPDVIVDAGRGEQPEVVPFDIHHRGDCPLDCPWCNGGGEGRGTRSGRRFQRVAFAG